MINLDLEESRILAQAIARVAMWALENNCQITKISFDPGQPLYLVRFQHNNAQETSVAFLSNSFRRANDHRYYLLINGREDGAGFNALSELTEEADTSASTVLWRSLRGGRGQELQSA